MRDVLQKKSLYNKFYELQRLHAMEWTKKITILLQIFGVKRRFKCIDLLKPTGYVMHQEFNIQQLYALPTLYLCVLYLSENKQRLVPLTA